MKWFPNAQDVCEDIQRESAPPISQYDNNLERIKRPGHTRLSATFTESRPWNFMTSSQASDRSSSSSRKRRSLFGNRSSTTSSGICNLETSPLDNFSPNNTFSSHVTAPRVSKIDEGRPVSVVGPSSRTTMSGLESWRSSIFSRKRTSKLTDDDSLANPRSVGRKASTVRSSMDFWNREDDSEDAFYQNLKKSSISPPFNFQHVTHTQKDHLPQMDSVTNRELVSEFLAASTNQAPRRQLRGIPAQSIERGVRGRKSSVPHPRGVEQFEASQGRRAPSHNVSPSLADHDSTPATPSDAESTTPVCETRPALSGHGLSSTERLASIGVEQREPPAMLHPPFRGQVSPPVDSRPQTSGLAYDPPAAGLDSVPEENEMSSPPRPRAGRFHSEDSPRVVPASSVQQTPSVAALSKSTTFIPFPIGNAFAQAYGGTGIDTSPFNEQTSFSCEESIASLTSADTWETEVDLLYLVEAESTCDFDWTSIKSSRKGSVGSPQRRDSDTASSLHANSVRDDTSTRPSSQRTSIRSYHDDGVFTGFDGASPLNAVPTQKYSVASRRHSAVSASNAELSTIPEAGREFTARSLDSSAETVIARPSAKHRRSASYSGQRPEAPKRPTRWSIASPFHLPEDVRCRKPSFTTNLSASLAKHILFTAPLSPPPALPLPEIPKNRPTGLISPPLSPPTLSSHEFSTLRRPSSSQDRALLQAAGRIVQRGRSGRPATPSRLSHVQSVKEAPFRIGGQPPIESPKMDTARFELASFPTPPNSPPPPQHEEAYPAWI